MNSSSLNFILCPSLLQRMKPSVLVRVTIAMKRHHDHGNFYKEKIFNWDWSTGLEVWSIIIIARSTAALKHTWCWRRGWEFYIWIIRKRERDTRHSLSICNLTANQWHISSNKATPNPTRPTFPIMPLYGAMGITSIQAITPRIIG